MLLGSGHVDVLAIESCGRPVVIKVKLSNNTESPSRGGAQVLAYDAALHGVTTDDFQQRAIAKAARPAQPH